MWHWSASFPQNDSPFLQPAGNSHQPKESQSIQRVMQVNIKNTVNILGIKQTTLFVNQIQK